MLLAHLSDTHLVADPTARVWGHNPVENLTAVINALPTRLDALVLTGDIAEDGSDDAYRLASALTAGRADQRFFIPGNHDDPARLRAVLGATGDVQTAQLSAHWSIVLLDSQWMGHDGGRLSDATLAQLEEQLARASTHVVLCLHHPPISPCPNLDCGMASDALLRALRGGPVRLVLSGHVHQHFDTTQDGVRFIGAPSTLRQLRHGGDPHYVDTKEAPAGQLVDLDDSGEVRARVIFPA